MGHHTPDRTSVDFSDLPAPIRTYHSGITVLLAVSSLRNSDRTCLYLRLRRNKSSLRCPPALENRIPDRTFRLLLHHIYTSSLLLALSSAPASLNHTPDRIFLAPLFRRNRSMYHPVAVPALFPAAVFIASICPPTRRAAAVVGLVVIAFSSHSLIFLR